MEEINSEIMRMITEFNMINSGRGGIQPLTGTDRYGYEFEPLDTFSTDPLGFAEKTLRMQNEAMETFTLVRTANRHSPMYHKLSARLEKLISYLGSCCITKAVMEQPGETFRLLNILTTDWLRGMAAFILRKCYAAFMECRAEGRCSYAAFDLSVRWELLDRRLEATAEKIEKIKAGKISIDLSEKRPSAEPQAERSENKEQHAAALPVKGTALPVDKAAVRKILEGQAEEEPEPADVPGNVMAETEVSGEQETEQVDIPDEEEETFRRDVLMQDAVDRADQEAFRKAWTAKGPMLEFLWNSFMERDAADGFAALKRMGIMLETADPPPEEEPEPAGIYELEPELATGGQRPGLMGRRYCESM